MGGENGGKVQLVTVLFIVGAVGAATATATSYLLTRISDNRERIQIALTLSSYQNELLRKEIEVLQKELLVRANERWGITDMALWAKSLADANDSTVVVPPVGPKSPRAYQGNLAKPPVTGDK